MNLPKDSKIMLFSNFTGKPLNEIDYPAITICSQGSMEDMIEEAVKQQFERYAMTKKNKNITGQDYRPKRSVTEDQVLSRSSRPPPDMQLTLPQSAHLGLAIASDSDV